MTLIPVFIRVRYFTDEQKKPQKNTHSVFVNGAVKEHKKNTCMHLEISYIDMLWKLNYLFIVFLNYFSIQNPPKKKI